MKTLLANKQTDEQKRSNEYARYQFILAMMNIDERLISVLLKKDGRFLCNKNKWQSLYWFKKQFSKLNPQMFHSNFKEGISLDCYPGSDILEFSYAPIEENSCDDPFLIEEQDEEAIFNSKTAFKIRLVLLFENGKIADIRVPNKMVNLEISKKLQKEN